MASDPALARAEAQLRALRAHEDGTRAGTDIEELHQFRVAIRRLRSLLKGTPALDPDGHLRAELKWLGDLTSPVRDLDVLLERLHADAAGFAPQDQRAAQRLVAALRRERGQHRSVLNRALSGRRYAALLAAVEAMSPASQPAPADEPPGKPPSVRKPYRKLAAAVQALGDDPPDDDLHALRIHGKRLRYAAETAQPTAGADAAPMLKELVRACKGLQDVLGEHQDAVVAATRVRELGAAHPEPAVAFVAGRLVEREQAKRAAARAAWPDAWRRVSLAAAALA